ncbi:MAG: hypothetical protein ACRDAS_09760, partial [Cetobacterium sp.]
EPHFKNPPIIRDESFFISEAAKSTETNFFITHSFLKLASTYLRIFSMNIYLIEKGKVNSEMKNIFFEHKIYIINVIL